MASEGCSSYVLWNVTVLMELMMGHRGVFILCSLECDSADGTHDGPQRGCSSYVLWNVIVLMELMMGFRGVFIVCC